MDRADTEKRLSAVDVSYDATWAVVSPYMGREEVIALFVTRDLAQDYIDDLGDPEMFAAEVFVVRFQQVVSNLPARRKRDGKS
jgi:hypothetical protein